MDMIGAIFRLIGQVYRKGKIFLYHKKPGPKTKVGGWGRSCDSVVKAQWVQGKPVAGLGGD